MSVPSFGVELHEYLDARTVLEEVRLAERMGYDSVWFGDSQLIWREMYVLMGAAAVTTPRVALGTGVTNPSTRHAAVTASALVTLQELSGHRIVAGVGVGDSALITLGRQRLPRAELAAFVRTVRALCNGETVDSPTGAMRLSFGAPGKCPPILIAGSGPKMLELAGEVADGAILAGIATPGETLRSMLASVRTGRAQGNRASATFPLYLAVSAAVHRDRRAALAAVRPNVARSLLKQMWPTSEAARRAGERVRASYQYSEHMDPEARHRELVPDDVIGEFAIAGTAEECVERVSGLFDLGLDEITIRPCAVGGGTRHDMIQSFAQQVIEPYRRRYASAQTTVDASRMDRT